MTAFTTEADCRIMTSGATVFRILSEIADRHQTALWDGEIMSGCNINVSLLNWSHTMKVGLEDMCFTFTLKCLKKY